MSPSGEPFFIYTYAGGRPPASLQELTLWKNGQARYLIGNSWPRQPPFDEIGTFRDTFPQQEVETLVAILQELCQDQGAIKPRDLYADAGLESFEARLAGEICEAAWNPDDTPEALLPLIVQVNRLLGAIRERPSDTLQARLEAAPSQTNPAGIRLFLSNRGDQPIAFFDFEQASLEDRSSIRLHYQSADSEQTPKSISPIQMLRKTPLDVKNPEDLSPDPEGIVRVPPGKTIVLELSLPEVPGHPLSGAVFGLVQILFRSQLEDGSEIFEQGWLLPQPARFGG